MVCERLVCDKVVYVLVRWRREAGGGGGADPGYRIKNKNSTQSCGEKEGNSMQLKVSPVPPAHRPQSLMYLSEPQKKESFMPSTHVLEMQSNWHQQARYFQRHLNQKEWHQQASAWRSWEALLWTFRNPVK